MSDLADVQIDEKIKVDNLYPERYKVVFLNDNVTPIDFVTELLTSIFKHTQETAITYTIHNEGSAVVGIYTHEIAEQKGIEATNTSRANGFPLKVAVEKE